MLVKKTLNDSINMNILGKQYSWTTAGILAALVLVAAYYIGTRTGKGKSLSANSEALDKELKNGSLTYDLSQYGSLADKLETAMFPLNDDEDAVYSVMSKLRSKSDVLQLIKSFGERRLQFTWGGSTLNFWINYKLNNSEIKKINSLLSDAGINYEF